MEATKGDSDDQSTTSLIEDPFKNNKNTHSDLKINRLPDIQRYLQNLSPNKPMTSDTHIPINSITLASEISGSSITSLEENRIQQFLNKQVQIFQQQRDQTTQSHNSKKETIRTVLESESTEIENTLSICTHNIRGINKETDQDTLI